MPRIVLLTRHLVVGAILALSTIMPPWLSAQDADGVRPLLSHDHFRSAVSNDSQLLDAPDVIERFLKQVDVAPPDWKALYGHHGAGHDERLFALNRERDRLRKGRHELEGRMTFLWSGELSGYDPESEGFRVAVGPKLIPTRWGVVRFKPESLPSNLVAVPPAALKERLRSRVSKGERIEIDMAVTGRLVAEESIIYDFAHEEPGQGMVMPVVQVERVQYILKE